MSNNDGPTTVNISVDVDNLGERGVAFGYNREYGYESEDLATSIGWASNVEQAIIVRPLKYLQLIINGPLFMGGPMWAIPSISDGAISYYGSFFGSSDFNERIEVSARVKPAGRTSSIITPDQVMPFIIPNPGLFNPKGRR